MAGLNFCSEIRDFLKERAQIEKEYSHKLEQLNKRYSKQNDRLADSLVASPTPASAQSTTTTDGTETDNLEAFKFGFVFICDKTLLLGAFNSFLELTNI